MPYQYHLLSHTTKTLMRLTAFTLLPELPQTQTDAAEISDSSTIESAPEVRLRSAICRVKPGLAL